MCIRDRAQTVHAPSNGWRPGFDAGDVTRSRILGYNAQRLDTQHDLSRGFDHEYSGVDHLRWPGGLGGQPPDGRRWRHDLGHRCGHRGSSVGRIPDESIRAIRRDRMELAEFWGGCRGSDSAPGHPAHGTGRMRIPGARPLSAPQTRANSIRVRWNVATPSPLSLIHISEPTRRTPISYAVFCLKKKNKKPR